MKIRINKYLSTCGIGPRRMIEVALKNGEFEVNGKIAEPGMMIDDEIDKVFLQGKQLKTKNNFIYYALNKPAGYVSTVKDEKDRKTVLDLIKTKERLYPIGRLDKESTGLILLTNDGDLALKITHPRYHLPKIYVVSTFEKISDGQLKQMEKGVMVNGEKTLKSEIKRLKDNSFEITLYQGMKRQIREMCKYVDLNVKSLHRISIGPIKIGNLKEAAYRELTKEELLSLKDL
jgi:23S rRNA pseudouridine2605 synthase